MAKVIVLYDSLSGNTQAAAEAIAAGASDVPQCEVHLMKAVNLDMAALERAEAVALGSPNYYSYVSGRLKTFFDLGYRNAAFKGKPFVAFATHGGGGGITPLIEKLAGWLGMARAAEGIDIVRTPSDDDLVRCRRMGNQLGRAAVGGSASGDQSHE